MSEPPLVAGADHLRRADAALADLGGQQFQQPPGGGVAERLVTEGRGRGGVVGVGR